VSNPQLDKEQTYRIALALEYVGASYSGWQKQSAPQLNTVQHELEQALSKIADHKVTVSCAGRTDSGVHATCQVVHFECKIDRGEKAWVIGSNSILPPDIRVVWARNVSDDFHARFSALFRRYQYVILEGKVESAILAGRVTQQRPGLDHHAMNEAAQLLLGERDFTSFRAAGCQSKTPNRNVHAVSVTRSGNFVLLDIQANAFLQHMVRNIAGSLLSIGRGEQDPRWIGQLLDARDRGKAGVTASPDGLYLVGVGYPAEFNLPDCLIFPPTNSPPINNPPINN
jgi:tRNA pseudouridine38-40 synthase